jgi:hypothetical protein
MQALDASTATPTRNQTAGTPGIIAFLPHSHSLSLTHSLSLLLSFSCAHPRARAWPCRPRNRSVWAWALRRGLGRAAVPPASGRPEWLSQVAVPSDSPMWPTQLGLPTCTVEGRGRRAAPRPTLRHDEELGARPGAGDCFVACTRLGIRRSRATAHPRSLPTVT